MYCETWRLLYSTVHGVQIRIGLDFAWKTFDNTKLFFSSPSLSVFMFDESWSSCHRLDQMILAPLDAIEPSTWVAVFKPTQRAVSHRAPTMIDVRTGPWRECNNTYSTIVKLAQEDCVLQHARLKLTYCVELLKRNEHKKTWVLNLECADSVSMQLLWVYEFGYVLHNKLRMSFFKHKDVKAADRGSSNPPPSPRPVYGTEQRDEAF